VGENVGCASGDVAYIFGEFAKEFVNLLNIGFGDWIAQ
jgi:hypothetical protein